ncbi:unnamed protein product [Dovyalis caffra]|uniref:Uncharacterized protein n=1 Tax=Dovyalis caffra TaxID=77055 RepID=A0AAV1RM65_9ROSI|nr:unnamed protein product [Dovyalis caffra]
MNKTFACAILRLFILTAPFGSRADCVTFKDLNAKECAGQDASCFSACVPAVQGAVSGRCILNRDTGGVICECSRADCVTFKDLNAKDCAGQDASCFSACVPAVPGAVSGRCILNIHTGGVSCECNLHDPATAPATAGTQALRHLELSQCSYGSTADCVTFIDLKAKNSAGQDASCFSACVPAVPGAVSGRCILNRDTGGVSCECEIPC